MASMTLSLADIAQARDSCQDPRGVLKTLLGYDASSIFGRDDVLDEEIWLFLYRIGATSDRKKLIPDRAPITELQEVIDMIDRADKIVVLLGAGGSVGPDFRSAGGLYDQIARANILDDPCDVFDLKIYRENPTLFWHFAPTIFPPEQPQYSRAQLFIEKLAKKHKLLRLYSQNVDTLEKGVPDEQLRCVHGSWRKSKCSECGKPVTIEYLRPYVKEGEIPKCPECGGIIDPGIVFFGQDIHFDELEAYNDAHNADLLLVIGTSLKVAPISELPSMMSSVPSILFNRAPVGVPFNAEILGDCDDAFSMIEYELGWTNEGIPASSVLSFPDRSYVIPSKNASSTHIEEATKTDFLVYPYPFDISDLD